MALSIPTVEVEAKISKESIIQLVIGLAIVIALAFMMLSITKFSRT